MCLVAPFCRVFAVPPCHVGYYGYLAGLRPASFVVTLCCAHNTAHCATQGLPLEPEQTLWRQHHQGPHCNSLIALGVMMVDGVSVWHILCL